MKNIVNTIIGDNNIIIRNDTISRIRNVEDLPQGWNWVNSTDGSGSLLTPEGDVAVDYVLIIGTSDIRYRFSDTGSWMLYVGTEKDFKDLIIRKVRDGYDPDK
ncbi:hypothetical protein MKC73_01045 [[Clostridium] innocuum]|nr:hypothetical protein [[Clostridium] innocuum]